MLIFIGTQDMVDYHMELLETGLNFFAKDEDSDDDEPNIKFFKLHGNMLQNERTKVFNTFRKSKTGVLLCTVRIFIKKKVLVGDKTGNSLDLVLTSSWKIMSCFFDN